MGSDGKSAVPNGTKAEHGQRVPRACAQLQKDTASTVGKKSDTQPEREHKEKWRWLSRAAVPLKISQVLSAMSLA